MARCEPDGHALGRAYLEALDADVRARHGRHYTPSDLAQRVWASARTALGHGTRSKRLSGLVRDPAAGGGALLLPPLREHLAAVTRTDPGLALAGLSQHIEGIDTDPVAAWLASVVLAAEALNNPLAAAAVTTMVYVGAVVDDDATLVQESGLVRPSTCLWMQEEVLTRSSDADREAWFRAATAGTAAKNQVADVVAEWGIAFRPWYGDNTRETLRNETLPAWHEHGAIRSISGLPTTSSRPRWVLTASFAALFDPSLAGVELTLSIELWRETRMSPIDR